MAGSNNDLAAGRAAYATLVSLRDKAGETHFARVQGAADLLKNHAWVEDTTGGGGNESRALDRLSTECFGDLIGGMTTMVELLNLYHHHPDVGFWRKHKFDVKRMIVALKERSGAKRVQQREYGVRRNDLTPPLSFPDLTPAKQKHEYARATEMVERWKEKHARLEAENAALKGQLTAAMAELRAANAKLKVYEDAAKVFQAKRA